MSNRSVPGVRPIRRGEANPKAAYKAKTRKSTRARVHSGEGYSKVRGDSRSHFTITIEHSNWDDSVSQAIRTIESNLGSISKSFKSFEANKSAVPAGRNSDFWATASFKTNDTRRLDKFTMGSLVSLEKFPQSAASELLKDIGSIGISEIRAGIRKPENAPTSARYDTGLMYNSVDSKIRKNKHSTSVEIGWTRDFYKYFDFQERGAGSIGAMNAIRGGYRRTVPKAYGLMGRYFKNYTIKSGSAGRYTK